MPVHLQNFDYTYRRKGKPIFAPSEKGEKVGKDIKKKIEDSFNFDSFVFHLQAGGHVAALHSHRDHKYFARIDIERFFYGIARSRVQRNISELGILRSRHYAKWSCVKNPYGQPTYSLPYGFVQSPVIATLVLMRSIVGHRLRELFDDAVVIPSVYMDDITLSSDNEGALNQAFQVILHALEEAHFRVNADKLRVPCEALDVFNCDLSHGHTEVQQTRIETFNAENRSDASKGAFDEYCLSVEAGNI